MSSDLHPSSRPFGLLEPLHSYILHTARPLTHSNWPSLMIIPLVPLAFQTYLIQFEETRKWRIAIGILGLVIMTNALTSYRFDAPYFNGFNNGIGIAYLHLGAKYVEFSLLKQPIIDPYLLRGRRRFLGALDLAINSRMVGLGPVAIDEDTSNVSQNGTSVVDGAVKIKGKVYPENRERWLPYVGRGRTRLRACLRHATHSYFHYVILDTLLIIIRHFGPDTVGNPNGYPNALSTFTSSKPYVLFPQHYPLHLPPWIIEIIAELSLAIGLWQGISWGYHFFAMCAVGSGLWETESWEVDMFDAPWKADSILDLWGRRWHQLFRHHFLLLSTIVLRFLHQPPNSPLTLPLIFLFSGSIHILGEIAMSPVPAPAPVAAFFFLSGIGTALEMAFRRLTGRRVRGLAGRVWTWTYMLVTARLVVGAWLDSGLGGSFLTPSNTAWTPADLLAKWVTKWVVDSG